MRLEEDLCLEMHGSYDRSFTIHLMEARSEKSPAPKAGFGVSARMEASLLREVLEDVSSFSDHVSIKGEGGRLRAGARWAAPPPRWRSSRS